MYDAHKEQAVKDHALAASIYINKGTRAGADTYYLLLGMARAIGQRVRDENDMSVSAAKYKKEIVELIGEVLNHD